MATATPTQTQLRSLYRRLLRELPTQSGDRTRTLLSHPTPLKTHIRAHLLAPTTAPRTTPKSALTAATLSDESSASSKFNADSGLYVKTLEQRVQEAEEFVRYAQSQRQYLSLLERYNPGMNMSEEERVRLSARRVGMNLPVEHQRE